MSGEATTECIYESVLSTGLSKDIFLLYVSRKIHGFRASPIRHRSRPARGALAWRVDELLCNSAPHIEIQKTTSKAVLFFINWNNFLNKGNFRDTWNLLPRRRELPRSFHPPSTRLCLAPLPLHTRSYPDFNPSNLLYPLLLPPYTHSWEVKPGGERGKLPFQCFSDCLI